MEATEVVKAKTDKSESGLMFPCAYCQMKFASIHECYEHVRMHVDVRYDGKIKQMGPKDPSIKDEPYEKTLMASDCSNSVPKVKSSIKKCGEKLYECQVCHKKFANEKYLMKKHLLSHLEACKLCSQTFLTVEEVIEHQKVHGVRKRYECRICKSSFLSNWKLNIHLLKVHGENPYSCDVCQEKFVSKQDLKAHSCVNKEHEWSCKKCPNKYDSKFQLEKHLRSHENSEAYICDGCGKELVCKKSLMRHCKLYCVAVKNISNNE